MLIDSAGVDAAAAAAAAGPGRDGAKPAQKPPIHRLTLDTRVGIDNNTWQISSQP